MDKQVLQIIPERKSINIKDVIIGRKSPMTLKIFDERAVEFLNQISRLILSSNELNRIAEIAALGFWLRKTNLRKYIKENDDLIENKNSITSPLGTVFHVCPSNVDTMFMYSLAVSLLMGNKNVLRISQRRNISYLNTLFDLINALLAKKEQEIFNNYICIITYEHDNEINEYFSTHVDARMIWGGDETIRIFKSFQTSPRIKDIVFADRVSYSLFKSSAYLHLSVKDKSELAIKFYNDSYSFNQKGCSCPQAIFVLGIDTDYKIFEKEFYAYLKQVVLKKYDADVYSLASLKLNQLAEDAINGRIKGEYETDIRISFAELNDPHQASGTCGGGLFYKKNINELKELLPYINSKVQTVSYFGLNENEIEWLINSTSGNGIDRLVMVGKALDFYYIWDGYNLFDELCCKRYVN